MRTGLFLFVAFFAATAHAENFFPLKVGNRWVYKAGKFSCCHTTEIEVVNKKTEGGVTKYLVVETPHSRCRDCKPSKHWYWYEGNKVMKKSAWYETSKPNIVMYRSIRLGGKYEIYGTLYEAKKKETMKLEAGEFETIKLQSLERSQDVKWVADGVGVVRHTWFKPGYDDQLKLKVIK